MTTPHPDSYRWRETYFVWFPAPQRPLLAQVVAEIRLLGEHYELVSTEQNALGQIESLMVRSPDDHAALEIDYAVGDDILLEAIRTADELRPTEASDAERIEQLRHCDARFELMHFEQFYRGETEEDSEEMFDPAALVMVMDALVRLTQGIGVDPQSGIIM